MKRYRTILNTLRKYMVKREDKAVEKSKKMDDRPLTDPRGSAILCAKKKDRPVGTVAVRLAYERVFC